MVVFFCESMGFVADVLEKVRSVRGERIKADRIVPAGEEQFFFSLREPGKKYPFDLSHLKRLESRIHLRLSAVDKQKIGRAPFLVIKPAEDYLPVHINVAYLVHCLYFKLPVMVFRWCAVHKYDNGAACRSAGDI